MDQILGPDFTQTDPEVTGVSASIVFTRPPRSAPSSAFDPLYSEIVLGLVLLAAIDAWSRTDRR